MKHTFNTLCELFLNRRKSAWISVKQGQWLFNVAEKSYGEGVREIHGTTEGGRSYFKGYRSDKFNAVISPVNHAVSIITIPVEEPKTVVEVAPVEDTKEKALKLCAERLVELIELIEDNPNSPDIEKWEAERVALKKWYKILKGTN